MRVLVESVRRMLKDDGTGLAAELAYRAFLALFPFVIFLTALSAAVASFLGIPDPGARMLQLFGSTVPANVAGLLTEQATSVLSRPQPGLLSVGLAGALWAATGGTNALIKALDRAYDVEETRPFYVRYPVAIGLTVFSAALGLAALAIVALTRVFASAIGGALGLERQSAALVSLLPLPIVLLLVFVAAAVMYRVGPNVRLPLRAVTVGAAFFALAWAVITYAFSLYVASFASYNATYGALGAVVVLLVWLYLIAAALVFGGELNAQIAKVGMAAHLEAERSRARVAKERAAA